MGTQGRLARLFPLPQFLLFPGTIVPLHIFEMRYRLMVEEALSTDRRIALCLLRDAASSKGEGTPPIHPVACLGKIIDFHRLPDGLLNIAVLGISRIRVQAEIAGKPFRQGSYERIEDRDSGAVEPCAMNEFLELVHTIHLRAPGLLRQIDFGPTDLGFPGRIADRTAGALRLDDAKKQAFLEESSVPRRIEILSAELRGLVDLHLVPRLRDLGQATRFDRN